MFNFNKDLLAWDFFSIFISFCACVFLLTHRSVSYVWS